MMRETDRETYDALWRGTRELRLAGDATGLAAALLASVPVIAGDDEMRVEQLLTRASELRRDIEKLHWRANERRERMA
jgi:hypothetical protein